VTSLLLAKMCQFECGNSYKIHAEYG